MLATFFFFYTFALVAICMLVVCTSTCAFMVTRRKLYLSTGLFFISYIIELVFIFLEEYTRTKAYVDIYNIDLVMQYPLGKLFSTLLLVGAAWWFVLEFVNKFKLERFLLPLAALLVVETLVLTMPDNNTMQWVFYTIRNVFLISFGVYILACYWEFDASLQCYLRKYIPAYIAAGSLLLVVIFADIFATNVIGVLFAGKEDLFQYLYGRNVVENILVIVLAAFTFKSCATSLMLRFTSVTPNAAEETTMVRAEAHFYRYCEKHELTPRERDVFMLLLQDKSNQIIADELTLTVGTIKTHIHNIYVKTGCTSREAVKRDFWSQ